MRGVVCCDRFKYVPIRLVSVCYGMAKPSKRRVWLGLFRCVLARQGEFGYVWFRCGKVWKNRPCDGYGTVRFGMVCFGLAWHGATR